MTDSKVAIITGGNQGIGWYTVLHLYLHGFKIYMLARNEERALKAIEEIKVEAEKRVSKYDEAETRSRFFGSIHYIPCDLLDLKNVEKAAETIKKAEDHLDIIINNAGLMGCPFEMTKDNYEVQLQVNVVSHVLLTLSLLPLLVNSKAPRVVQVSSLGHNLATSFYENTNDLNKSPSSYYSMLRYGVAKTAAIHFTEVLAKKYPNILCVAVHPGVIATSLYDFVWSTNGFLGTISSWIFKVSGSIIAVSSEVGAYASLRAALDNTLTVDQNNGCFLTTGGVMSSASKVARNMDYAEKTWNWNITQLQERGFKLID
ncbi:NAD(P)-dependent dehydrogenase [Yamadazyma tenuis]|nr:NAD(P)-dependent dehydrogenase [Yamadazyma tenuis]